MSELLPSVTLADADGDGVVKRTRRPALSCVECRVRKVKCDREKPCGGCIKIGSSKCTYRPSRAAARAISERSSSSMSGSRDSHRSSTQLSLHEPAPIVNQHNTTNLLSGRTRAHPRPSIAKDPRAIAEPRPRVGATSHVSVSATENGAFRTPITNELASEHDTGPIKGNITVHPGSFQKSKFFGQSHWMNALEPYQALGGANTTVNPATDRVEVNKSTELHRTMNELKSMARVIKSARMLLPTIAPEALNSLPSKDICDILVRCYFRTFEGVFRVLHRTSFQKEYDDHWSSGSQSKTSVMLKIMLVCAIGVPFYIGPDQPQLRVVCAMWIQAAESWLAAPHAKSRLNMAGIQIQILVLLAKQACNVEGDHVWISAGSLLRTAMYLGLHKDPAHFTKIKPFHAEMRRRLWTTVVELTVQSSLDMGMPPMLSEHDYDTRPPSNLDDCDMGEEDDDLEYVLSVDVYTDCSIQIAFAESLPIRLEIVRLINSLQFDLAYRECLRIGTELAKLCETKTCFFKKAFKDGYNVTPFQIKLLDSLVRRFVLGLHRPFFAKAKDEPQYHYSRKICLDASLAIFAPASASVAGVDDDWTLMSYRAVGFFKSLILFAMSTIYFELNTQIEEHRKLSSLMAPLVSEATAAQTSGLPPQTQILYDALVRAHHMTLLRLKKGETNPKGVVFFACALARIDALVSGTNPEAKVLEAARASVVEMRRIMADVYEQEHGESVDLSGSRTRDRGHGRGDGADDVTGRHLPTGTEANAGVGMEMSADDEFGFDFGSQSLLSGGMDFSSQFLQDPEWFFDSNDWTGMPCDITDFGEL